ncbi:anti-sigma factor [Streptomyces sp. NPDC051940]|uniref:anti-sigma factor family protein n=1 Tax=Streptomyces sp. NPDC051940 TaxID=3155675 RepID=UPI00342CB1AE
MSVEGGLSPAEQHLGDRLAALVDGELSHDNRDRVLAHLATCPRCKVEADALRQLKSALAVVAPPPPSDGLLARLQGLPGMDDDALDRNPFRPGGGGGGGFAMAEAGSSGGFRIHEIARSGSVARGRRLAFVAAGGMAFAAFALGGAVSGVQGTPGGAAPGPSAGEERTVTPAAARAGTRRGGAQSTESVSSQLMVYPYPAPLRTSGVVAPSPSVSPMSQPSSLAH